MECWEVSEAEGKLPCFVIESGCPFANAQTCRMYIGTRVRTNQGACTVVMQSLPFRAFTYEE